jgi:hypothetical protein
MMAHTVGNALMIRQPAVVEVPDDVVIDVSDDAEPGELLPELSEDDFVLRPSRSVASGRRSLF